MKIIDSNSHFRINTPQVIQEIIDGEAVMINLDTGSYYSIDKLGAEIWGLIESFASVEEIVKWIANRYEGDIEIIENAVKKLINELQEEHLIVTVDATRSESAVNGILKQRTNAGKERLRFESPFLHKYNDMQDLLLLDPIHDVDEMGWPSAAPDSSADNK